MSNTSFRTVTIIGVTGRLGFHVAEAFLNDKSFKVKILRRKPESENEKITLLVSKGAEVVYADYDQKQDLVKAFTGTDVIVSTVNSMGQPNQPNVYDIQSPLLAAAKEASVKRFIPSEYGCEYREIHPFVIDKEKFRVELEKSGVEYTYIYPGLFQEFIPLLGFDVKEKKATLVGDANKKLAITSMPDIAKYIVEAIKIPESRNAPIRVAGTLISLNELVEKFEKATGSKWTVVEDKNLRQRFREKIEPIPSIMDDFKATILENITPVKLDNDKFSFTPCSIDEGIDALVKQG